MRGRALPRRTGQLQGDHVRRSRSRRRGRAGLLTAAVAFARSPQGQRLIAEARRRYDTPENRARVREAVRDLQSRARAQGGLPGRTRRR